MPMARQMSYPLTAPPSPERLPSTPPFDEAEIFKPYGGHEPIHSGSFHDQLQSHLRSINVDECEANGENAFFVADLAEVYRQHLRWMRELPRVAPFYGELTN